MILLKIFRSEFAYQTARISTWLYFLVLLAISMGLSMIITTNDGVYINNTFLITASTVVGVLIWLLISAGIGGEAAARDVQMRIHPLIYTTPIPKLKYLGGRFLAAFAVNAILILAMPIGLLLSFYMPGLPRMDDGELLPFRPGAYLNVYFLIALPTVFIGTALQFTFAAVTRKVMTAYLAGFLLAIFPQIIAVSLANILGNGDIIKLMDPVGINGILGNEMQTWTPADKNTKLISAEGIYLWNRVLWVSVGAGLLVITWFRFSFTNPPSGSRWNRLRKRSKNQSVISPDFEIIKSKAIAVPQVQRDFDFFTYLGQLRKTGWRSFRKIAGNPLGLLLIGAMALGSAAFGSFIMTENGIPLLPTTQQVLGFLTAPVSNIGSPWVVIPLLLIYFIGELVWQERDANLSDLADATPVPNWVIFTGKFLGIFLIILVWLTLLMSGGILMQVILGYDQFEIGLYIKTLFGIQLLTYLLFALLVFVVHVVVNQKQISYLLMILIFSFMAFPGSFGIQHKMLIFGAAPEWSYSDMRGFGSTAGPWLWFQLYWIAWALLLGIAAKLLWASGREQGFKNRLQRAQRGVTGPTKIFALGSTGLLLVVGSFIFYNTNVLHDYNTASDIIELKAEYEKRYGKYRNTPQPQLTATFLKVELYPDRQEAEIHGTYTLVNKDPVVIDSIHIGSISGIVFSEVKFNREISGAMVDKELNHHIYVLKRPLIPGDSLVLNFVVHHKTKGFSNTGTKQWVVKNGTYFTNFDLLPGVGYLHYREIKDAYIRKKQKLVPQPEQPSLFDPEARKKPLISDQTTLEVIVGTAKDEIAVAPGVLQRTWQDGNRNYFHYQTDASIGFEYSILSADYKVKKSVWNDVAITIYYHGAHNYNIDKMLSSAKASLEYYSEHFGPYPYKSLTLIERAGPGGGATADAGIIYYGEQYPLLNADDSPEGFDLPYYIMAHEVAHQWWGLARLTPAYVEGAGVLIEGLAVYSGMQVLEKTYGEGHLRKYVDFLHSSYALPRSLASASLLQANEEFLYYRKGGIAMHTLSEYMGKDNVNAALRNLLQKRTSGELPLPTTLDLYTELQKVTPDSLKYLLNDFFKENTYWRLKTKQFSTEQATGGWEVTLKVEAQKLIVDRVGKEINVPMNDWLEIGIYEEEKNLSEPLYLKKHLIKTGEQMIKVTVPRKPDRGGIDPNQLMIDLRFDDNIKQL